MYSGRTGESLDTIYWIEGEYIPEALNEISYFMRDWRQDEVGRADHLAVAESVERFVDREPSG